MNDAYVLADATSAYGGLGIVLIFLWLVGIGVYFIPTIVAFRRDKSNKIPILVLNFFLGWSLIGWVVSLVWALSNSEKQPQQIIIHQTVGGLAPPVTTYTVEERGEG